MIRGWLIAMALVLAVAGCQVSREARADSVETGIDQPFTLHGGQEATISGQELRLRFTEVLEDSRCPTQVECFWTGQARIAVVVTRGGSAPSTVEFNTNPAPGQHKQTLDVGGYTIELQSLDPYPQTPDEALAFENYRATLLVRKVG